MELLGVIVNRIHPNDEISIGKSYPDNLNYPTPIKLFPDIAEPGKQIIFGHDVIIFVSEKYFTISITNKNQDKWYFINDQQIETAKKIEQEFELIDIDKYVTVEGQKEYGRFINKYHYPELFDIKIQNKIKKNIWNFFFK